MDSKHPVGPLYLEIYGVIVYYLEGQGDLVSGLVMGTTTVVIGIINLLTKSP